MTDPAAETAQLCASLLTPRGRGAVATIRFEGDVRWIDQARPVLFRAANGRQLSDQPLDRIVFGRWGDQPSEEVVVCRCAPEVLEIHCHGGEAAARRILGDLKSIGCAIVHWQDAVAQADGHLAAECLAALTAATTFRAAEILLEQQSDVLRNALEDLLAAPDPLEGGTVQAGLEALLRWSRFGLHLTRPWSVVLAGRPNVGKSSLINALVGYARSIVYDQPGTTRDVVTAETAFDGWPIQFADTAGIRAETEELESAGIDLARRRMLEADLRVLLLDTSRPPREDDWRLLSEWPDAVVVAHKADLPNVWGDRLPAEALPVSSVTGARVEDLARTIVARLIPEIPPPGTPIPFTPRQMMLLQEAQAALTRNDLAGFRQSVRSCLGASRSRSPSGT